MKKLLFLFLSLAAVTGSALAWGQNGHRVVGLVAERYMSPLARMKVDQILQGNSLAEVSTWMDEIRSDTSYKYTSTWHWVTIPDGKTYEETTPNPTGDALGKIEEITAALKAGGLSPEKEAELIKFLVHLVGDIHQPLHVGTGEDRGGNDVRVMWMGDSSNLHRVWDQDMIEQKDLSYTELAGFLPNLRIGELERWQTQSVREWAEESMTYREQVYNLPDDHRIGYVYLYHNWDAVQLRLLQAGVRLAGLLNEIYG